MMSWKGMEVKKKKNYIYRSLCKNFGKILETDEKKFICEMNFKKNNTLFEQT